MSQPLSRLDGTRSPGAPPPLPRSGPRPEGAADPADQVMIGGVAPRRAVGRERGRGGDHVPLYVDTPQQVFHHPSVVEAEVRKLDVPVRLWIKPEVTPEPPTSRRPTQTRGVVAVDGAPGLVGLDGGKTYGVLHMVLTSDDASVARLAPLFDAVRTPEDDSVRSAVGLCGSGARPRVSPHPGDIDFNENVVIQAASPDEADRILARRMVDTIRQAERAGLTLMAVQVGQAKYLAKPDGIHRREGWYAPDQPLRGDLASDLARELQGRDHDFLKLDFVGVVDGRYRDVTKNMRYAVEDPATGRLQPRFSTTEPEVAFEELYRSSAEAALVSRVSRLADPEGMGSPEALRGYTGMLEREIRHFQDPFDSPSALKTASRLYNWYAVQGRWREASRVARVFTAPCARVAQVTSEMDTLARALDRKLPLDSKIVSTQIDGFLDRLADAWPGRAAKVEPEFNRLERASRRGDRDEVTTRLRELRDRLKEEAERDAAVYLFERIDGVRSEVARMGARGDF